MCKSPLLPLLILLWKGENKSFLRGNEKKVNERKVGTEAGACFVHQALSLKPKMYGALWKIQRDDGDPAFRKLNVQLGEKMSRPAALS